MQHNILHALNKRRDSGRSSSSHSPTATSEQMKERFHNIAQDVYILNRSCLVRARSSAPKKKCVGRSGKG